MDTFVNAVASDTAINPAIIQMILAFITQMLAGCTPKPATAADLTASPFAGLVVNRAMRENGVRPFSDEGRKLHASILKNLATAPEADVKTFLSLCQCQ